MQGSVISPSTRSFAREARRVKNFSLFDFIHGYIYGRWPYLYIRIGTGEHPLAKWLKVAGSKLQVLNGKLGLRRRSQPSTLNVQPSNRITFQDTYHGKVVPLEAAKQLVMVNEPVRLENLEKIIPYAKARDIILQNPDHIIAMECPCRAARSHPCLPLDVCLIVGEPFAGFVAEHHPRRSRWISQAEAVEILQQEDERGHVHHAFFKDAMLGRFYAICNCCACCCGAMQAQRNGVTMLASSGYVCRVDETLCIGCAECQPACSFNALSCNNGYAQIDRAMCMGCGVCVARCPQGALALERAPEKGESLEIARLIQAASDDYDRR